MRRIKKFGGKKQTLPIKDPKLLKQILDYLIREYDRAKTEIKRYQAYRNYMIVLIGVNTAFRAEDLLQLRVRDVIGGQMQIKENKTGKMQIFPMNRELVEEIKKYVDTFKLKNNDYLFMGQKKKDTYKGTTKEVIYPITRQCCDDGFIRKIEQACGINFVFGMHSLRKTFGYMYILNGGQLLTLQKMYNHEAPDVTLLYVMWNSSDIEKERESIFLGAKI